MQGEGEDAEALVAEALVEVRGAVTTNPKILKV